MLYQVGLAGTTYTDSGLTNGTTYYYTVTAVNDDGEGAASNEASATPSVPPLPAPALSATAASGQASLTWTAVAGATSYNLYRYGGGNDWNWTLLQVGLAGTTYTDTGLTDGTTYQYYVCAVSKDGQGSQSNNVSVLPGGPALALAAHVVWTRDYTASPATQTASTSGAFGGSATLHLTLTGPQTLWWGGAATATVRVHEAAAPDASGDLVWTGVPLYGSPSAACGEPSASPPPYSTQCYLDVPWNAGGFNGNAGGFNGNYVVTATVQASVGGSATPQTVTLDAPLSVDREDLLITGTSPQNPTPLVWDPSANGGSPAPLTVSATLNPVAYRAGGTATLKIYTSDNNTTPVETLTEPFKTTDGSVSFTWNGTTQIPSPITGLYSADLGEYTYQFSLSDDAGVSDTDKSVNLQPISVTSDDATLLSDDGTTATYSINYTLNSSDRPARPGSAGRIDVYDPSGSLCSSRPLLTNDPDPNASSPNDLTPGAHTVSVSMPSPQLDGDYIFLTCVQDSDASSDRGHRSRYALQHNNRFHAQFITLLDIGGYHVAWGISGYPVRRSTVVKTAQSHLPSNWVKQATSHTLHAAVNGMFFGGSTANTITIAGQAGPGWSKAYVNKRQRWCFGMSEQGNGFDVELMTLPTSASRGLSYAARKVTNFEYGFSEVGLLVTTDRDRLTGAAVTPHEPQLVDIGYSNQWPLPQPTETLNKTAVAWSKKGDFFVIVGPGDWNQMANFIISTLPNDTYVRSHGVQIKDAVMLDGGTSSEFGWEDAYPKPPLTDFVLNQGRLLPCFVGMQYP